jgi:prevent-host-death family protein
VRDLAQHGSSMVITQNGEAKAVLQGIHSYEQTQETLALLKVSRWVSKSWPRAK